MSESEYLKGWRKRRRGGKGRYYWYKTISLRPYCIHRVGLCQWQVAIGVTTLPGITTLKQAKAKAHAHAERRNDEGV